MVDITAGVAATGAVDPELRALDRLRGTWDVSGGASGRVEFEWMEGGFFLVQRVDLEQFGQPVTGVEVIGRDHDFGSEPSTEIRSCFYDSLGNTLRYVYEPDGDTLTIWGGEKGSPAFYEGRSRPTDTRCRGRGCTRAVATSRP